MEAGALEQEIRSLIASATRSRGPGSAARALAERLLPNLSSPADLGEFYRLAFEAVGATNVSGDDLLIATALEIYGRIGGLTARQAHRLIERVAAVPDPEMRDIIEVAQARCGSAKPTSEPDEVKPDEVKPVEVAASKEAPEPEPEPEPEGEIDPHNLALISWATLHATLPASLAARLEAIAQRFAGSPLSPGSLRVTSAGNDPEIVIWGPKDHPLTVVASISGENGQAELALADMTNYPHPFRQSIPPLLRALLENSSLPNC